MRAVIQRVSSACVSVEGEVAGSIGAGLLIFLGVGQEDSSDDIDWLVARLVKLRIFEGGDGRMSDSLFDVDGEALVISQFTLYGSLKKGNRPSFNRAAPPELAVPLYEAFVVALSQALNQPVPTGRFGEDMKVEANNDGPVTLIIDTKDRVF